MMDFRGAVVEDLGLPVPRAIFSDTLLDDVRELVLDDSPWSPPIVPVIDRQTSRLVGYLTPAEIDDEEEPKSLVQTCMHSIKVSHRRITVASPLEELVDELNNYPAVEIWDASSRRVLAVATEFDVKRRFPSA